MKTFAALLATAAYASAQSYGDYNLYEGYGDLDNDYYENDYVFEHNHDDDHYYDDHHD